MKSQAVRCRIGGCLTRILACFVLCGLWSTFSVAAAEDTWTKRADMPTTRAFLATSAVNGKIYAIGGLTAIGVCTSAVEEYDTGFVSETSVEAKEKLAAVWGGIRCCW